MKERTTICSLAALGLAIACLLPFEVCGAECHVSPTGDDANPGTPDRPLRTLSAARSAARARIAAGLDEPLDVVLHDGIWFIPEPLRFTAADGGSADHAVTWRALEGAAPVVSGGVRVGPWQENGDGTWSAPLPEGVGIERKRVQLWVNGRWVECASRGIGGKRETTVELATLRVKDPKSLGEWAHPAEAEIVFYGTWGVEIKDVAAIDRATGTITLRPPHVPQGTSGWNYSAYGRLYNLRELVRAPGDWCVERGQRRLTYLPAAGEDMRAAAAIVPRLTTLVEVAGTVTEPVRNLHFSGITFAHATVAMRDSGYRCIQATTYREVRDRKKARRIGSALLWTYSHDCSVRDCTIAQTTGSGLTFETDCHRNTIEGNHLFDIGGNGIAFAYGFRGVVGIEADRTPTGNRIANNHIHHCGRIFKGAVGIWCTFVRETKIIHNDVHSLPYTGISLGWCWNTNSTPARDNLVAHNHIHSFLRHRIDGGGIYTLGVQPGTALRGNYIHGIPYPGNKKNGIFFDQGSDGYYVEGNRIHDVGRRVTSSGSNLKLKNNSFDDGYDIGDEYEAREAHAPELDPGTLTLEARVTFDHWLQTKHDDRRWIAGKNAHELAEGHYALFINGDRLGAFLNIGGGRNHLVTLHAKPGSVSLGKPHALALTYDGTDLRLFVDGTVVATQAVGKPRRPGTGGFAIGGRWDNHNYGVPGTIHEVRLYREALDHETLRRHAEHPDEPEPAATLVRTWRLADKLAGNAGLEPTYRHLLGSISGRNEQRDEE